MITNASRQHFIESAIRNFESQSYRYKTLIVVNHTPGTSLVNQKNSQIHEFFVDKEKQHMTLGALRNMALDAFVPNGALWTPFDDDDWRSPDYLLDFYKRFKYHNLDLLFMKNRLEYNKNNGYIFRSRFEDGRAFFLARKFDNITVYDDLDTLEDTNIDKRYREAGKKIRKFNNDPKMYIRVIHTNNTSVYVQPLKTNIVKYSSDNSYHEFDATIGEKEYVEKIMGRQ